MRGSTHFKIGGIEPETDAYISRVQADSGAVLNETFVNDLYSTLKAESLLTSLTFWISAKAGLKKDGSQFISKVYDLNSVAVDAAQTTGANQPDYSLDKINFSTDFLTMPSKKLLSYNNGTIHIKFSIASFPAIIVNDSSSNYSYIQVTSTAISVYGKVAGKANNYTFSTPTTGVNDLFIVRNGAVEDVYLNGVKASTSNTLADSQNDININLIGKYSGNSNYLNGSIEDLGLFTVPLTVTQMNLLRNL